MLMVPETDVPAALDQITSGPLLVRRVLFPTEKPLTALKMVLAPFRVEIWF